MVCHLSDFDRKKPLAIASGTVGGTASVFGPKCETTRRCGGGSVAGRWSVRTPAWRSGSQSTLR